MMDYTNPNIPWMNTGYDPYKGMNDEERMNAGCMQATGIIIGAAIALLICLLFGSCKTTEYVQVPVVHNDTLIQTKILKDSVWIKDSTHVSEKGDTVRIHHWHTEFVKKEVRDTIYQSKTDSIPYPVEVIKEVPADLTWWQKTRLYLANIMLVALLLTGVVWIGKRHIRNLGG